MAIATKIENVPEVYAGLGADDNKNVVEKLKNGAIPTNILSGPNWFYTLTGNTTDNKSGTRWYCLDLLGKYHTESPFKQFHALTFYFRHTSEDKNKEKGAIITSMLPESLSYSIGGNYTSPIRLGGGELANAIFREFTGGSRALEFNVDTSVVWHSPKRLEMVFKIPVFDDSGSGTNINYQEAIDLFGEAILPELGESGLYESTPGPNILTALKYKAATGVATKGAATLSNAISKGEKEYADANKDNPNARSMRAGDFLRGQSQLWDRISIQIGGVLLLDWCVIKDLKVTFPNTRAMVLHDFTGTHTEQIDGSRKQTYKAHLQPIQAEIEVTVSTVMGMTRATFKNMLYQTETVEKYINGEKTKTVETPKEQAQQQQQQKPRWPTETYIQNPRPTGYKFGTKQEQKMIDDALSTGDVEWAEAISNDIKKRVPKWQWETTGTGTQTVDNTLFKSMSPGLSNVYGVE